MKKACVNIRKAFTAALLAVAALLFVAAFSFTGNPGDTDAVARRTGALLSKRIALMDGFAEDAMAISQYLWMRLDDRPEDIVVYRYYNDTLQSWAGEFPLMNDDIRSRLVFPAISGSAEARMSPLTEVTDKPSFVNYGSKWYVVKAYRLDNELVICGLEVMDTQGGASGNGVNPRLGVADVFTVSPLMETGGSAVYVDGEPIFKIASASAAGAARLPDGFLMWLSCLFYMLGSILFVSNGKQPWRVAVATLFLLLAFASIYFWGGGQRRYQGLFSPTLYADGSLFSSFAVHVIVSATVFLVSIYAFIARVGISRAVLRSRKVAAAYLALTAVVVAGILAYAFWAYRSLALNSGIQLELYKVREFGWYSVIVYVLFFDLFVSVLMLLQMARPVVGELLSLRYDMFSHMGRGLFAVAVAVFMTVCPAVFGLRKEADMEKVWANRLSMDRDISLELNLRGIENQIAADGFIASISALSSATNLITSRLEEVYFPRLLQEYDFSVRLFNADSDPDDVQYYNDRLRGASLIASNSKFLYTGSGTGQPRYAGIFRYVNDYGIATLLVEVEPKTNKGLTGFASIVGVTSPGQVELPSWYSYAKYVNGRNVVMRGEYPYPTMLTAERLPADDTYRHYYNETDDSETIIISRAKISPVYYLVAGLLVMIISYVLVSLLSLTQTGRRHREANTIRDKITLVLMASLVITLVAMMSLSLSYIVKRTSASVASSQSDKIGTIRTMAEERFRVMMRSRQLSSQEAEGVLAMIGNVNKTDITLYSPAGLAFLSTAPQFFESQSLNLRLNSKAYDRIVFRHRLYYVTREEIDGHPYRAMYAPMLDSSGEIMAIIGAPYSEGRLDLVSDGILHIVTVFVLFVFLLLLSRFMVGLIVNRMFKPLTEMGRKMNAAQIGHLQYIIYDQNDEISALVRAYNLMVHDLSESTKKLTAAERDKAWSGMARQVAHEIKNPLTPMKLQLQRLIRLKQKGDPAWNEKFNEVSQVLLDHIDILADTANEFSTFAKLYSEEPVEIDLDGLLREEIEMFDNREGLEFEYMGLSDAVIMGPKPQLTRVAVNLLTNSVQAIENQRAEDIGSGREPLRGKIRVSLRNSQKEGFYDIVFEDNGPGVSEENRPKLFTPNFTTKSSGTGLGLSICRNIIEKCGGDIFYSKSFLLLGACFTVRYPKGGAAGVRK